MSNRFAERSPDLKHDLPVSSHRAYLDHYSTTAGPGLGWNDAYGGHLSALHNVTQNIGPPPPPTVSECFVLLYVMV